MPPKHDRAAAVKTATDIIKNMNEEAAGLDSDPKPESTLVPTTLAPLTPEELTRAMVESLMRKVLENTPGGIAYWKTIDTKTWTDGIVGLSDATLVTTCVTFVRTKLGIS